MPLFHRLTPDEKAEEKERRAALREKAREQVNSKFERFVKPAPPDRERLEPMKLSESFALAVMPVKHAFRMGRKNKVVTGTVTKGLFTVGDEIYVSSGCEAIDKCVIVDIAQFNKHFKYAHEGCMVQMTLDAPNVNVVKGDVLMIKGDGK